VIRKPSEISQGTRKEELVASLRITVGLGGMQARHKNQSCCGHEMAEKAVPPGDQIHRIQPEWGGFFYIYIFWERECGVGLFSESGTLEAHYRSFALDL
jgi:hypothetical protein